MTTKTAAPTLTKNIVQFRSKFVNLPNAGQNNKQMAVSVLSELLQFGYVLSNDAIDNLASASREDITSFHNEVLDYLKYLTGSGRTYRPFWPGFPTQVMEMDETERWINQILHYWTNGSYLPDEWTKDKPTAFEQPKYYEIGAGNDERFEKVFTTLVSVNQSLTPEDLSIVKYFVTSGVNLRFPDQIPFKENLCTLAAMGIDVPVKTVTDVLRISVGMSGGDISLPAVPPSKIQMNSWSKHKSDNPYRAAFKFKNFSRSERRIILGLLEKTNCDVTEAVLKEGRWIRLGEKLHPGEFKSKFPKSFAMFNKIRNEKVQSWYGKVNKAFDESFESGVKVLAQRPGEFVRRMDWMLRPNKEIVAKTKAGTFSALEKYATQEPHIALSVKERKDIVLNTFKEIAKKVSNKVLYEVYRHFEGRYIATSNRGVMIKGARKRTPLPELPSIAPDVIESVQRVVINTLIEKFSELPKLGKVAIDENLKKIPLPTNMRSASTSLRPTMRGQRVPIGNTNAKVIRAFVHWFDEDGRIDIDLSATLLGDGNGKTAHFGWNASHKESYGCHSGDVICRPGACAEYIDVNVEKALKDGLRYVIVTVHNFRGNSLASIKDCVAGAMEREFAEANLDFVPATLANCMRLESPASTTLMCIVDLETREYIHLDVDTNGIPVSTHQSKEIFDAIKPYMELPKFSVYDLIELHATARAEEIVDGVENKADVYFTFDEFSESYVKTMEFMGV